MIQAKFQLNDQQNEFLNDYEAYGFKNKSAMVREAINFLKKQLDKLQMKRSAELYNEIYEQDNELQELTDSALTGWPE